MINSAHGVTYIRAEHAKLEVGVSFLCPVHSVFSVYTEKNCSLSLAPFITCSRLGLLA